MPRGSYPTLRGPLPAGVKLEENVYVTMRDGVKIALDIYYPEAEGRYPAILGMSPYIKEIQQQPPGISHNIEAGATSFFVPKGYVHVIAQVRGTGLSQGQWNLYDIKEQQDGYELVEWIARQPWCDGNVGMLGDSYFAMIQYLVALQKPPHLKCLVPFDGGIDIYRELCYPGGLFWSWFLGMWLPDVIRLCVWPGPIDGKLLPSNLFADIASHPEDGPYYWERSAATKLDKIDIPIMNMATSLDPVHSLGQLDGHSNIKATKKLLVMPPGGRYSHVFFILNKSLNEQILRWFDYWLKGKDTGIMDEPEVAIFDSGTREWRYENEYPLARTKWTEFYLRSNPDEPTKRPLSGLISTEPPGSEEPDRYFVPEFINLVATGKRAFASYATSSLKKDLRVWGPLSITLYGSSTSLDTVWFVKLGDVDPDGKLTLLTSGHLKASYRKVDESRSKPGQPFHTFQNPVRPEPNAVYEYKIEMIPIFNTFKAGHKIWVQITNQDLVYQLDHDTTYISETLPVPTENTIYHNLIYPSHLVLPVISDAPIIKPVGPPVSQINWSPLIHVV